jgi:hypothetical protein
MSIGTAAFPCPFSSGALAATHLPQTFEKLKLTRAHGAAKARATGSWRARAARGEALAAVEWARDTLISGDGEGRSNPAARLLKLTGMRPELASLFGLNRSFTASERAIS